MGLVINLPPAQEMRLQKEAQKEGVTVDELVRRAVDEKFPALPDEDVLALELIERWIAEAPADPEQAREAEEDLRTFQRSLNGTRAEAGARLPYPTVE